MNFTTQAYTQTQFRFYWTECWSRSESDINPSLMKVQEKVQIRISSPGQGQSQDQGQGHGIQFEVKVKVRVRIQVQIGSRHELGP